MKNYPALMSAFYGETLLLTPEKAQAVDAFLQVKAAGGQVSAEEVKAACEGREESSIELVADTGAASTYSGPPAGTEARYVAVVPQFGMMMQHGGMMQQISGGVSTESLSAQLRELDATPAVRTIVLHVHSPGGQVFGTREYAGVISQIAKGNRTRIVTVGNSQVASAALWTGVASQELHMTPGGQIGSLGVLQVHEDVSAAEEQLGRKTTLLAIPARKVEGNPYEPLGDEARDRIMGELDATYQDFLGAVAGFRGVTTKQAEDRFGGGGMLTSKQAKAAGLIDGINTLHAVVGREVKRIQPTGKHSRANANRLAAEIG